MTPIVLHHGLIVPGHVNIVGRPIGSFIGIHEVLAERGFPLIITQVHPSASVAHRAAQLKRIIREKLRTLRAPADTKVCIFAHSMGGLDARHMITHLGMDRCVAALLTLSTPHRGSAYADWCVRNLSRFGALRVLNALGLDTGGAVSLTRAACARFNEATPDVPGVKYFSISAARPLLQVSPLLFHPHRIVSSAEGLNDGLVSVRSARWGKHLETWPADHLHMLNRRLLIEWKTRTGDIRPYYVRLIEKLAALRVLPPSAKLPAMAK